MSKTRWAAVLVLYGVAAIVITFFLGPQIPPCFGSVPTGEVSAECIAAWQASRSLPDRLLGTPLGGVLIFFALAAATWVVVRLQGRNRASEEHSVR